MDSFSWQGPARDAAQASSNKAIVASDSPLLGGVPPWRHVHTSSGGSSGSGRGSDVGSVCDPTTSGGGSGGRRISTPDSRAATQHRIRAAMNTCWVGDTDTTHARPSPARLVSPQLGGDSGVLRGAPSVSEKPGTSAGHRHPAAASPHSSPSGGGVLPPPLPPPPQQQHPVIAGQVNDVTDNAMSVNSVEAVWGYGMLTPQLANSDASSAAGGSHRSSPTMLERDRRPSGLENVPRPNTQRHALSSTYSGRDGHGQGGASSRVFLVEGGSSLVDAGTPTTQAWVPQTADTSLQQRQTQGEDEEEAAELQAAIDAATARFQDLSSEEEDGSIGGRTGGGAARGTRDAVLHKDAVRTFFDRTGDAAPATASGDFSGSPLRGDEWSSAPRRASATGGDGAVTFPLLPTHTRSDTGLAESFSHATAATAATSLHESVATPASLEGVESYSIVSPLYDATATGGAALLRASSGPEGLTAPPIAAATAATAAAGSAGEPVHGTALPPSSSKALLNASWYAGCHAGPSTTTTIASPTGTQTGMSTSRRPSAQPHSRSFSGASFTSPPVASLQLASPPQDSPHVRSWQQRGPPSTGGASSPTHLAVAPQPPPQQQRSEESTAAAALCTSPPSTSIEAPRGSARGGGGFVVEAQRPSTSASANATAHATAVNSPLSSPSAPSFQTYHMPQATLMAEQQNQQQQQRQGGPHMILYSPPQVYMSNAAVGPAASAGGVAGAPRYAPTTTTTPQQYPQQQQQQHVLQSQVVAGCTLTPSLSSSAAAAVATSSVQSSRASRNLYFRNLPRTWNTTVLRELCATYGAVMSAKVAHHPTTNESLGYGFVLFESTACAAVCVATLNQALIRTEGEETRTLLVRMAHASAAPGFQEDPEEAAMAAGVRTEGSQQPPQQHQHLLTSPPPGAMLQRGSFHSPTNHAVSAANTTAAPPAMSGIAAPLASAISSPHSRGNSFTSLRALSPTSLGINSGDASMTKMPAGGDPRQVPLHLQSSNGGGGGGGGPSLFDVRGVGRGGYAGSRSLPSPLENSFSHPLDAPTAVGPPPSRLPVSPHVPPPAPTWHDGGAAANLPGLLSRVASGATLSAAFPPTPASQQPQPQQMVMSGRGGVGGGGLPGSFLVNALSPSLSPTGEAPLHPPAGAPLPTSPTGEMVGSHTTATSTRNVYVTNLPLAWNTTRLRDACSPFGPIVSASVAHHPITNESRGYGFVLFGDAKDAATCVAALHQLHVPDTTNVLVCRFAKEKATPSIAHAASSAAAAAAAAGVPTAAGLDGAGEGAGRDGVQRLACGSDGTSPTMKVDNSATACATEDVRRGSAGSAASVSDAVLMPIDVFSTLQERVYTQCVHHVLQQQQQQREGAPDVLYRAKATTPLGVAVNLTAEQKAELEQRMRQCVVYGCYVPGQGNSADGLAASSSTRSPHVQTSPCTTSPWRGSEESATVTPPRWAGSSSAGVVCSYALPVPDAARSPSAFLSMTAAPADAARSVTHSGSGGGGGGAIALSIGSVSSRAASTSPHTGTPLHGSRVERWWYTCTLFTSPGGAEAFMREAAAAARTTRTAAGVSYFDDALVGTPPDSSATSSPREVPGVSVEGRSLLTRYGRCERVLVFSGDHTSSATTAGGSGEGRTPLLASTAGTPTTSSTTPPRQPTRPRTFSHTQQQWQQGGESHGSGSFSPPPPQPPQPRSQRAPSPLQTDAVMGTSAGATGSTQTAHTETRGVRGGATTAAVTAPGRSGWPAAASASGAAVVSTAPVPPRPRSATLSQAPPLPLRPVADQRFPSPPHPQSGGSLDAVAVGQREACHHPVLHGAGPGGDLPSASSQPLFATYALHSPPATANLALRPAPAELLAYPTTQAGGGSAYMLPYGGLMATMSAGPVLVASSMLNGSSTSTAVPALRRDSPASVAMMQSVYHTSASAPTTSNSAAVEFSQGSSVVATVPSPYATASVMVGAALPGHGYAVGPDGSFPVGGYHIVQGAPPHP